MRTLGLSASNWRISSESKSLLYILKIQSEMWCFSGGDDFSVCKAMDVRFVENPLDIDRPGVGIYCIYLFFEGILYFILTLLIEVATHPTWASV